MNVATVEGLRPAPIAATWICLAIAWVCFIVPVPGLGILGWLMNLVAFILAIVVMTRGRTAGGLVPLIASIVVSPILYFIGLAIFAGTVKGVTDSYETKSAVTASSTMAESASPARDTSTLKTLTAEQLFNGYTANEVAADDALKGKDFKVTGKVESINKDAFDGVYVSLATSNQFMSVHARGLDAAAASALRKGQSVTLACTGNGMLIGSPQLKNCTLLNDKQ